MSLLTLGKGLLKSKLFKTPFSANFKITERCNLRCPLCSVWRIGDRQRELSLDDIKIAVKHLKNLGLSRLVITGGEPMIRKDLVSIVHLISEQGISPTLLTNGILGRDMLIKEIFDAGLDHMAISLDYLKPEKQDSYYNHPGAWRKIMATIHSAREYNKKGMTYVMTSLLPDNIHEIIPLFWTLEAWGVHFILNPIMGSAHSEPQRIFSGITERPTFNEGQIIAIEVLYRELIRLKRKGHRILISEKYLRDSLQGIKTNNIHWNCHAGQLYFNIFSDGGVAPCNEYPSILSVIDPDFVTRFYSESFQNKAQEIRTTCTGCTFGCWRELSSLLTDTRFLIQQSLSIARQKFR